MTTSPTPTSSPATDEVDVVLRFPTTHPERVVGAELRPSRPLTHGPRHSDRWLAWCLGAALLLLGASSLWTSARAAGQADTIARTEAKVEALTRQVDDLKTRVTPR